MLLQVLEFYNARGVSWTNTCTDSWVLFKYTVPVENITAGPRPFSMRFIRMTVQYAT